jgi:hypothetical protein
MWFDYNTNTLIRSFFMNRTYGPPPDKKTMMFDFIWNEFVVPISRHKHFANQNIGMKYYAFYPDDAWTDIYTAKLDLEYIVQKSRIGITSTDVPSYSICGGLHYENDITKPYYPMCVVYINRFVSIHHSVKV